MNRPSPKIPLRLIRDRAWTLATAESCTGGLLGDLITNEPGSSEFFLGGVIAYSNRSKRELLEVGEDILKEDGAVSSRTALAMARGVKKLFASSIGAAITGIAGPGGGGPGKPVGLVYIAVAGPGGETVEKHIFSGTRREIKRRAAVRTLDLLIAAAKPGEER
jgi:PncC family amidohydrolase